MTDVKEKAKAAIEYIEQLANEPIGSVNHALILDVYTKLLRSDPIQDLKAAIRPSRKEVAGRIDNYNKWLLNDIEVLEDNEREEINKYLDYAIEYLRENYGKMLKSII